MSDIPSLRTRPLRDQARRVEAVLTCPSRPVVRVIGTADFLLEVSAILEHLNYTHGEPTDIADAAPEPIMIIDGAPDDALDLCLTFDDAMPKILVSAQTSFAFRMQCVRAHVSTIIGFPIDQKELVYWLEHLGGQLDQQPPSILLVDDDPLTSAFYAEMLSVSGMMVQVLNEPSKVLDALDRTFFDIIIMDLQMPDADGIELARVIRQHQSYLSIPIVFLSSEQNKGMQMRARQFGGDDFISKRVELDALVALIHMRVERARLVRGLIERDGLTGLLNHRRFKERVGHELARVQRSRLQFCVAMIDVDHFKNVNDTWGHPVGDHVLSILARMLVGSVRQTDVVGRYGGEEFAILLLDTSPQDVFGMIDALRLKFADIKFDGKPDTFSLTISIGVAGSNGHRDPASVFAAADKALYQAKGNGRNQVVVVPEGEGAAGSQRARQEVEPSPLQRATSSA